MNQVFTTASGISHGNVRACFQFTPNILCLTEASYQLYLKYAINAACNIRVRNN